MANYRDLIGCKYKIHGRSKEEGFDCYGLVIEVYKRNGIELPDMFYMFQNEIEKVNIAQGIKTRFFSSIPNIKLEKPEDLCIIEINVRGNPIHVGVYIGKGMMIHCTHSGVIIEPIRKYTNKIVGYYKAVIS